MVDWLILKEKALLYLNTFFSTILLKLIVAVIILLIGFIIGRVCERIIQKVLHELELDRIMKKAGIKMSLEMVISSLVAYLIYFLAIIIALNQLGLTTVVLYIIVSAIILLIIISTLLAIKDYVPNIFAAFFIYRRGLIKEGEKIKLGHVEGRVKKIGLVETEILTKKCDTIFLPNSLLIKSELTVKRK